jgi:hypothetical protein
MVEFLNSMGLPLRAIISLYIVATTESHNVKDMAFTAMQGKIYPFPPNKTHPRCHDFIDLIRVLLSFGRSKQGEGKNKSPATAVHLQMTITSLDGRRATTLCWSRVRMIIYDIPFKQS